MLALAAAGLAGIGTIVWAPHMRFQTASALGPPGRWVRPAAPLLPLLAAEQAAYQRDVELQLAAYELRLQRLEREAAASTAQAREALRLDQAIQRLAEELIAARHALGALRLAGEATWLSRRSMMEAALHNLARLSGRPNGGRVAPT